MEEIRKGKTEFRYAGLKREPQKTTEIDEELEQLVSKQKAKIKVIGTGGSGNNTINRMSEVGIVGAETIAVNTDAQDLLYTNANAKILIGKELTSGLGAGSVPQIGEEAAKESEHDIKAKLTGADMVFITCGLGGGCLRGSSNVYTNPDGPIRIDSIKPGSYVYSLENGEIVKKQVLASMRTGIKKVYEIRTRDRALVASYDHPFLKVIQKRIDKGNRFYDFEFEWTEAESLKPKDLVVTLKKAPEINEKYKIEDINITKDFCRLYGFLLGDEWITRSKDSYKIYFSPSKDKNMNAKYTSLLKEIFGLEMKRGPNWYYANSKKIYETLDRLGLHKKAVNKEIPEWVFKLPHDFKKALILGLADADGHYLKQIKKDGREKLELRFEMHSEKLINQLKVLCEYSGLRTSNIASRIRVIKAPHSKEKKLYKSWNLRIYGLYDLDSKLEENTRERKGMQFLYKYRGNTKSKFFKNFGFSRIISVKEVGEEDVYDITVEGSHNFVSEGFVVHNTGTGSAPVIADIAKKLGILTVAIVTLPFSMEGNRRYENAITGLEKLEQIVDTLIVIPNDKLLELAPDLPLQTAFKVADEILTNAVKGIAELITKAGLVNLDFADIRTVMGKGGVAMIGVGESDSESRAIDAVEKAISNPLLDVDISGANGALINISGGEDMTLEEARKVVETISDKLDEDARIIWGAQISEDLGKTIRALLIVTGVKSPQIFGKRRTSGMKKKKEIENELGIDFVD
ncbi:MAG: hypothetical protein AB1571_03245 [Nanoarchaeota archaeon]